MANKKPMFVFQFPSAESASSFMEYAIHHSSATRVQNPLNNCILDLTKVLVSGAGSIIFDMNLKEDLVSEAKSLGGVLVC